jgi:selenide, water dikinase
MQTDFPYVRDLVLIGGGHAHALVLRKWAMNPQPGVQLTVINPAPVAAYTGMLPGVVAGHYRRDEAVIDLVRLCRFAGARLVLGAVSGIDPAARLIEIPGRPPLRYDIASLDVGVLAGPMTMDGITHAIPARPLDTFLTGWEAHLARNLPQDRIVIIGGGVAGAELALAIAHRLQDRKPDITVIDSAEVARALPPRGKALLRHALTQQGIKLRDHTPIASVSAKAVTLADGTTLPSDLTIAVAGAAPHGWLQNTGLDLTNGFVTVSPTLQSSDPAIFAAGDCAHLPHAPRPKAGVFAVRAAAVLHDNLRNALSGRTLRPFQPQKDYLKLISLGEKSAMVERNDISFAHPSLWRWKNRIDRSFMDKLTDFPAMPAQLTPPDAAAGLAQAMAAKPLCGGCGAKVDALELRAVLNKLPAPKRAEVQSGPGDDAAILRADAGFQVMTTDHLRSFTTDPYVMARIAANHALGDIWAMGATPQVALAQITLPRMASPLQAALLADIMAGAAEVFSAAGADVVGGHTSVGAELTLGFTVTGLADRVLTKGGARPGDRLILTKPIGSGTIMAAEMAIARVPGLVLGEAVAGALTQMQRSLGPAAHVLAGTATAMTDVTGFGLAGHLAEMLQASGCAAQLDLASLPFLPGSVALAASGHASSLAPANRAAMAGILPDDPRPEAALLIDPQTAGGLLAAVPPDQADRVLQSLLATGETAAIIGVVEAGALRISLA